MASEQLERQHAALAEDAGFAVAHMETPGGLDLLTQYLLGAKKVHNISFDWIGIWNEAPWSSDYILTLRRSLDSAGLKDVQITAADGGTDVITAAAK